MKDIKDTKNVKLEIKELEKPVFDTGPKTIVEGPGKVSDGLGKVADGPGGPIGQNPAIGAGLKPVDKLTDKPIEKIKDQKDKDKEKLETKETKDHKESKDNKDHKEAKEHKDQKEGKDQKDGKEHKDQKEHKEQKDLKEHTKHESKDHKVEIKEQLKELEKTVFDNVDPKQLVEGGGPFQPGQPVEGGGFDARMAQLEAAVAQLSTFIAADLRPDPGAGALTNEGSANGKSGCQCDS